MYMYIYVQQSGGYFCPVFDEELDASSAVAVLQESGDHKLEQNQLQLNLSYWTDGTTHTYTHIGKECKEEWSISPIIG